MVSGRSQWCGGERALVLSAVREALTAGCGGDTDTITLSDSASTYAVMSRGGAVAPAGTCMRTEASRGWKVWVKPARDAPPRGGRSTSRRPTFGGQRVVDLLDVQKRGCVYAGASTFYFASRCNRF